MRRGKSTLYLALACYVLGTIIAFAAFFSGHKRMQTSAFVVMATGFAAHTFFIGTICARTGHPPLTNLPEAAAFISWTILAIEFALDLRYRVQAAALFAYPLALLLLVLTVIVGEPFAHLKPSLRSSLFTMHILLTTVGIAGLFIALCFTLLAFLQDRSLMTKTRGRLWELIPNLKVCRLVAFRALMAGFIVYTLGLVAGVLWTSRPDVASNSPGPKEIGATAAWALAAILLQLHANGVVRGRRVMVISAGVFVAIVVSLLGISHV